MYWTQKPVTELGLDAGTTNALESAGINNLTELIRAFNDRYRYETLVQVSGVKQRRVELITDALSSYISRQSQLPEHHLVAFGYHCGKLLAEIHESALGDDYLFWLANPSGARAKYVPSDVTKAAKEYLIKLGSEFRPLKNIPLVQQQSPHPA